MKKTIHVTQEDINNGQRYNSCGCPVALAAKRAIPNLWKVGYSTLIIDDKNTIRLPFEAQDFVSNFDNARKVKPFSFEIELPD